MDGSSISEAERLRFPVGSGGIVLFCEKLTGTVPTGSCVPKEGLSVELCVKIALVSVEKCVSGVL